MDMNRLVADLRQGLRANLKYWPSTVVIVMLLGYGIGSTVSVFNMQSAMTWRPMPFRDPAALVALREAQRGRHTTAASWPSFLDWRRETGVFAALGAYESMRFNVGGGHGEPENLHGTRITPGLLPLLGVGPRLGRVFTEEEGRFGRHQVVLIDHSLWEKRFDRDPAIVGRTLRIDDKEHVIVGVMPPRFAFPEFARLWTPLAVDEASARRDSRGYDVVGRLAPGITLAHAQSRMNAAASQIASLHPETNAGWGLRVSPLKEAMLPSDAVAGVGLSAGAVVLILAITCANVALLLLARFQARGRETSVRLALGATRGDLTRRFLVECFLLAAAGGILGLPVSILSTRLTRMAIPIDLPYWLDFGFRPVTFILAAVITVTAALMAGLVPAVRSSRQTLADALREESRSTTVGARAGRLRQAFAISQFALSFALLTSALLLALSFFRLQRFDHGFDARHVLTMRISLRGDAYEERAQRLRFAREILGNAQGHPGVTQAAVANDLPLRGNRDSGVRIVSEDRSVTPGEEEESQWRSVSPGYLDVFRIPLLRGRRFTETEDQVGAHVILISDSLARRLWPNGDALGRRLRNAASPGNWWEVIGITGTVRRAYRMGGIGHAAADRQIYAPLSSHSGASYRLAFRSADDLDGVSIATVKSALPRADSTIPLYDVASMETVVREAEWLPLLWIRLFSAFSLMALVLTSLGTYGIVSQSLQQRTQEMGVRLALGAEARQLSRLILHQAVTLAGLGIAFGLLVTVGMAPFLRVLLQGVDAFHPLVIAAAASVMAVMSLVAAGIPAWRAGRIDPIVALRCE